jgi:glucose/arabinose dehydrogenase
MPSLTRRSALFLASAGALAACAARLPGPAAASTSGIAVSRMAAGLDVPWAVAFLPDGGFLVTERPGRLSLFRDGERRVLSGLPAVAARGQGGLLDVAVARDFAATGTIFLTFAEPRGGGTAATALAAARLGDGDRLADVRILWRMEPATASAQHFGSRVVEAPDGTLFVTTGDRGDRNAAQDPANTIGTIVRVNRDNSIPADNPFIGRSGIRPEIWSWGLRNLQGAALGLDGTLWTVMHGPRGGDEVNHHAEPGLNYGWPIQSFGAEYATRRQIGTPGPVEGMTDPVFVWRVSPAVSGLAICSGRMFPHWRGNLLVGALQHDTIIRLVGDASGLVEAERLLEGRYRRIRDVREAPDGAIWFIAEAEGAVYRMTPSGVT